MKMFLLIIFYLLATTVFSQNLLKPVPRPTDKIAVSPALRSESLLPGDSIIVSIPGANSTNNVIRITVVAAFIVPLSSGSPNSSAQGGIGVAWQHLKYDFVNLRYQSQYSIGLYGIGGSTLIPNKASGVVSLAALFGFAKDFIRAGPCYQIIRPIHTNGFGFAFVLGGNFNN